MNKFKKRMARLPLLAGTAMAALIVAACGGGSDVTTDRSVQINASRERILKGGTCTGSCTGGGGTPVPAAVNPLPTTAPAPDVLVYEGFGEGPEFMRPKGGKGEMRSAFIHTSIGGFWAEYLGSKNNSWITDNGDQAWKFAAVGGYLDPARYASPLENDSIGWGVAFSEWFDLNGIVNSPTALLPFTSTAPYAVEASGYPVILPGGYVGVGLTGSGATLNNFATVGQVWLGIREEVPMTSGALRYELRVNGMSGPLLASGLTSNVTYNRMIVRYDPVAKTVGGSINGVDLGTHAVDMPAPRYAGFEGVGLIDSFVIRRLR